MPPSTTYSVEWLIQILVRHQWIDKETQRDVEVQLPHQRARVAMQHADEFGGSRSAAAARYKAGPGEVLASFGFKNKDGLVLDENLIAQIVAKECGLSYYHIDPLALDMEFVSKTISRPFALRHVVLPLSIEDNGLLVAVENPFDVELVENLRRIVRADVRRVISSRADIVKALTEIFGFRKSVESAAKESSQSSTLNDFEQLVKLRTVGEIEATDQHVVNAVDSLLRYAFEQRASDIHIEPKRKASQVRLRIDGVLHDTHSVPKQVHPAITARIKTLARMDIAEKRRPQDGRMRTVLGKREVELRVSTLPITHGEKIVIRVFDSESVLRDLQDLGFDTSDFSVFQRWISKPHGLILITGPTGSGKTTTLYAALKQLADETVNVTTVEDPIEMVTDQFNQTAVQHKIGLDFASALRSILRQDPDIIMIGEIRDRETAEMAIQAALTGHLVFSTLHTNDSVGAVTRLIDLGVPPFLVATTLIGTMAQRLMRRVCNDCKISKPLTPDQLLALGIDEAERHRFESCYVGQGCITCRNTGYYGRIGIFEMFDVNPSMAGHILGRASEEMLRKEALQMGTRTLRNAALDTLSKGTTSAEELLRVTGLL